MPIHRDILLAAAVICTMTAGAGSALSDGGTETRLYRIVDGKVDARTYNGYRRYHASCNHCHGPDGAGSSFGPPLVDRAVNLEAFRAVVRNGKAGGSESRMKGFADDPNVAPYLDDILAYLQARADGALGRGRPLRQSD